MITDNDLDAALQHTDPMQANAAAPSTLDALLRSTESAARKRTRRRLFTGIGIAGIVVIGGTIAAPAAADVVRFLAETDWSCGWGSECGDPEAAWIDSSAPDIADYVVSVAPESIPFAEPWTRDEVSDRVLEALADNPGMISEVSVERMYESIAYCSWVDQWLAGDDSGDAALRDEATLVMREAVAWPAMTATDGGGIIALQDEFASSAESGDRTGVEQARVQNECAGWVE